MGLGWCLGDESPFLGRRVRGGLRGVRSFWPRRLGFGVRGLTYLEVRRLTYLGVRRLTCLGIWLAGGLA